MKTFSELLGENRKKMAEQAAEKGSEKTARTNFKLAADAYRAAAGENPQDKNRLIALADEMDSLATGDLGAYYTPPASKTPAAAAPPRAQSGKSEEKAANGNEPKPEKKTEVDETELGEALADLNGLIGLSEVKTRINEWVDQIRLFKVREHRGLPVPPITYHMVFTGNPGTGKTTVARLIAKIYHALGIIRENKCKEVGREDLVAQYVGQTAIKTKEVLDEALGGILFIDEAYTLKKEGNDFGQEAIDTLLKVMEDQRDEISVIAAGYEEDMQKFIKSNAGLSSRFKNFINFADYDGDDLFKIFAMNCKKRKYVLTDEGKRLCKKYFNDLYAHRDETFGNARDVRNFFEDVVTKQAVRLSHNANPTDEELCTILPEDILSVTGAKLGETAGAKTASDPRKAKEEYERVAKDNSAKAISDEIGKGDLDGAVVALCVRLESILKYKYNLEGDLFTMIDTFIANHGGDEKYRVLHKLRMKRNTLVHSEAQNVDFTKADLLAALAIVEEMDGKSGEIPVPEEEENIFEYRGGRFVNPSLDLLDDAEDNSPIREANKRDVEEIIKVLVEKLNDFGVKVEVEGCIVGAAYSRIEMKLLSNTQLTTIAKYEPDLAMVLKRKIRLLLPIEGKDLIGIEVQNAKREVLTLKAMLSSEEGRNHDGKINTGIGYDIEGKPVFASFDSLPHALVGGSTGSGKSVFLSSVISGIIFRYQPKDVRLVLIDFKRVEMNVYNGLPFVVGGKAIDDFDETQEMFDRLTDEMERRYTLLSESRTRNFKEYNDKASEKDRLPAIVIIIDEYADMVSNKGYKELAVNIQRIAQKARAAGMYMFIATQRPSAKVIDGVIKANLPSRIAFSVASHVDSMNILDAIGAEDLIGAGDMLFEQGGYIKRLQAPYISTEEIGRVADAILGK